jgi:Holliday junction resolvase RusA-like endonuclease
VTLIGTINVANLPPRPGKAHWRTIHKAKNTWTEYIRIISTHHKLPLAQPGEKRHVKITFHRPGPDSDIDNLHAMLKVPLDALVRTGLLVDDSPAFCTVNVSTISTRPSKTVIELHTA